MTSRTFGLMLAMTPGIGGRTVTRVLARHALLARPLEAFLTLSAEAMREEYGLSARSAKLLSDDPKGAYTAAEALDRRLAGFGVSMITAADAHYPPLIEAFDPDPPGVLFLYGNTKLLEAPSFCVLGSRKSPPAALNDIERLTEEGVLAGEVLVSGHDTPEYQRSAVVPLRWGAPRILCFDRGLFKVLGPDLKDEAFRAARLWRYQYDPTTDLAVSCFLPDAEFIGVNNKVRDRLVASLSKRLDITHMSPGGNMALLAKHALAAGRPVRVSDRILDYRAWIAKGATVLE